MSPITAKALVGESTFIGDYLDAEMAAQGFRGLVYPEDLSAPDAWTDTKAITRSAVSDEPRNSSAAGLSAKLKLSSSWSLRSAGQVDQEVAGRKHNTVTDPL